MVWLDDVVSAPVPDYAESDRAQHREGFGRFHAGQRDLGPKAVPRYVRVSEALPTTATAKILVRQLRAEGLACPDPLWELVATGPVLYASRDGIPTAP